MTSEDKVMKCLDLTASLVVASIQSGKFDAKDGQSVTEFFDKVFGKVADCMNLTSQEFIDNYSKRSSN